MIILATEDRGRRKRGKRGDPKISGMNVELRGALKSELERGIYGGGNEKLVVAIIFSNELRLRKSSCRLQSILVKVSSYF